ncbi:MAG: four helix bundle protein, partial [Gammaproteobacteria bacterium]|nr:four helix bundle protein [Gammaproteobacteria bacterium]
MENKRIPKAKAVQDCHELLIWLIPHLDKFPKARRFTLGDRLESRVLSILEDLVEATYSRQKTIPLTRANRQLETMQKKESGNNEIHETCEKKN